jgi:hypothetical protein
MGRVYGFVQLSGFMLKKKMETTGTPEKGPLRPMKSEDDAMPPVNILQMA